MSYARFSEGDVYVWEGCYTDGSGFVTCQVCSLMPGCDDFTVTRLSHMVTHLEHHQERGHDVPAYTFDEIGHDIRTRGDHALSSEQWGFGRSRRSCEATMSDRTVKRLIVNGIEKACVFTHPVVHHRPWLWLPIGVCPLARLSDHLDQRWNTGQWVTADVTSTEEA